MKLQLALDTLSLQESIELLDLIADYIDIIEVGTPFIIDCGVEPVRVLKQRYPHCEILADAKIMDGGEYEAELCFKAGADIVTVLAVAWNETILGTLKAAKKYQGKILVDMIATTDLIKRTIELDEMGVDYICVHTAFDRQSSGANPLAELMAINKVLKQAKSAVAGGLKLQTIPEVINEGAEIIVVGGGITSADDKAATALAIKQLLQ